MPKPSCAQCNADDSLLWRSSENGQICNECHLANTSTTKEIKTDTPVKSENEDRKEDKEDTETKNGKNEGESTPAKATGKGTRKSTRSTRYKAKTPAPAAAKTPAPRGRGRRSIFKRQPVRAPTATATVVTSESVFYKVK
jgi:GATA zinc finger domain-containing protein 1